jgi:hypothetical protein
MMSPPPACSAFASRITSMTMKGSMTLLPDNGRGIGRGLGLVEGLSFKARPRSFVMLGSGLMSRCRRIQKSIKQALANTWLQSVSSVSPAADAARKPAFLPGLR